jgi:hypothetical protein
MFKGREWIGVAINAVLVVGGLGALVAEIALHGFSEPGWLALAFVIALPGLFFVVVATLALASWQTPWRVLFRGLEALRFSIPFGGGLVVRGVIQAQVNTPAHIAFYEAAAQLIPVLALVFAVEGRISAATRGARPSLGVLAAVAFGVMAWGEYVSLRVLASGHSTAHDVSLVGWALATAAFYIIVLAIIGPMKDPEPRSSH